MSFSDAKFKLTHLPQLDGIRGIAVILVILFHSSSYLLHLQGGFIGVDIFFVLSGFLITSLLIQEYQQNTRINIKLFFIRRILRLQPAILILLLCLTLAALILKDRFDTTPELMLKVSLFTLFNVSNWAMLLGWSNWPSVLTHIWSLAIEEQFYLIWPFVLYLFIYLRIKFWSVIFFILIIICASISWKAFLWSHDADFGRCYFATDTRVYELLIGCVLSLIVIKYGLPNKLTSNILTVLGALIILTFAYNASNSSSFMYYGGYVLVSISSGLIIIGSINSSIFLRKILSIWLLRRLGKISYGLYLWQGVIFPTLHKINIINLDSLIQDILAVLLSILLSLISYYAVEREVLKLKPRFSSIK